MKVVGYGDNVIDRYINRNVRYPGGNCINFAAYARRMEISAAYLGYWGDDEEAKVIQNAMRDMQVDISYCKVEKGTVTERCDVNLENGERIFLEDDPRQNLHGALPLGDAEIEYLNEFDLIHCSCYAEEEKEIAKLKEMKALVTFDFAVEDEFRTEEYLEKICPYIDFALFSCEHMENKEIEKLLKRVYSKGVDYVLATMGTRGQILFDGEKFYAGEVCLKKAVDTMGAGDSFFTSFLLYLLKSGWQKNQKIEEKNIKEAFRYAAEFAAENCLLNGAFGYGQPIE